MTNLMRKNLDKLLALGWVSTVIFAALAQGAVEPWSQFILACLISTLFLCWVCQGVALKELKINLPALAWPLGALTLYAFLQSFSWFDANGQLRSLSYDPEATRNAAFMLLLLFLSSLLSANVLAERPTLGLTMNVLTYYGFLLAILALIQHFAAGEAAYWPRPISSQGTFGPFINRDHFAGYMELLVPLPLALLVTRAVIGQRRMVYGVMAALMGVALIFTLSRGGMISLLVQLLCFAAYSFSPFNNPSGRTAHQGLNPSKRWISLTSVSLVFLAIAAGVLWIGAEPVVERLALTAHDPSGVQTFQNIRGEIWRDSWRIFRAHPLTGAGFGAFETAFPVYAQDDGTDGLTAQAHNDYLQILADGGLIGGALALWFFILFIRIFWRSLRCAERRHAALTLGCGISVIGLLVHSVFDFNLQLPSHSLLFLLMVTCVERLASSLESPQPLVQSIPVRSGALVEGVSYEVLQR